MPQSTKEPGKNDITAEAAEPLPAVPDAGPNDKYVWQCGDCGRKMTDSQAGRPIVPAYQREQRRLVACCWCHGVAFHLEDEQRIRKEEARAKEDAARQRRVPRYFMAAAVLFFLALPACVGFLVLVAVSSFAGPLAGLEPRGKMASMILAGSCTFFLSFMGAGLLVPPSWLFGYALFIPCYAGVILLSLLISFIAHKIGSGVSGVIYRR